MLVKAIVLLQAAIILLGWWHLKAAFLIEAALLLLVISPVYRMIRFLSEIDVRLTYLESKLDCMWWWKRDEKLRQAVENVLLDELEGRTTAGLPRNDFEDAEQGVEGDEA